jgi:hypothetical protein
MELIKPFWLPSVNKDSISDSHQTYTLICLWPANFTYFRAVLFQFTQQQTTRNNNPAYNSPCDGKKKKLLSPVPIVACTSNQKRLARMTCVSCSLWQRDTADSVSQSTQTQLLLKARHTLKEYSPDKHLVNRLDHAKQSCFVFIKYYFFHLQFLKNCH